MPRHTKKSRLDELVAAFTELGPAWGRWLSVNIGDPEVSYVRLRLLRALDIDEDHVMTMSELASALDVTPRRITALVDALEADGLVRRQRHPKDGRSTMVSLTRKGSVQHQAGWDERQAEISRVFGDLSAEHQKQLLEIAPLLTEALRRRAAQRASVDAGD
jgi:DNA-binding MarR family transcriptional regulator